MVPFPFVYPGTSFKDRKHGPAGYTTYRSFKPWLRDEFLYRCAYCLTRERWEPSGQDTFGVDHIEAKSQAAGQEKSLDYDNLVCCCNKCNPRKKVSELPPNLVRQSLANHISFNDTGEAEARTDEGRFLIDLLLLNGPSRMTYRRFVLAVLETVESELSEDPNTQNPKTLFFGYPSSLPDLRALAPERGNSKPAGIASSAFVLRELGELPRFY